MLSRPGNIILQHFTDGTFALFVVGGGLITPADVVIHEILEDEMLHVGGRNENENQETNKHVQSEPGASKSNEIKGEQVKIGITAPKEVPVYRKEVYVQIQQANEEAMDAAAAMEGLKNLFG